MGCMLPTRVCVPLWSLGASPVWPGLSMPVATGQSSVQDWREIIRCGSSFLGLYTQMGTQNKTVSRQSLQRNVEIGPMTLGVKWRHLSLRIHFAYKVGVNGVGLMMTGLRKASDPGAAASPGSQVNCLNPAGWPPSAPSKAFTGELGLEGEARLPLSEPNTYPAPTLCQCRDVKLRNQVGSAFQELRTWLGRDLLSGDLFPSN